MDTSERVNLPRWRGGPGHYEIWFVVVFDRNSERACWVRYTTFAPQDGSAPRAMVWAAHFDAERTPTTIWAKEHHSVENYRTSTDSFLVEIGDAKIGHGYCNGRVSADTTELKWSFNYKMGEAPVRRTPAVLEQVKLATEAMHACSDAPTTGFMEVGGKRYEIAEGTCMQMHLHGTRRVDELAWIWTPFLGPQPGTVEVVSVRNKHGFGLRPFGAPRMTAVFHRHGDEIEDLTQFPEAIKPHLSYPGPGILEVSHSSIRRALRIRSYAELDTFAAWAYRNPRGDDLYVAQSDIASCVVETFTRRHPFAPWKPELVQYSAKKTALEFHGAEPIDGVPYVGWTETNPPPVPQRASRATPQAPSGSIRALPEPVAVVGVGTTFRESVAPVPSNAVRSEHGIYVFDKGASSATNRFGRAVRQPSQDQLRAALDRCEPGLSQLVEQRYPYLPPLLDFEVELVMVVLAPISLASLASGDAPLVGWTVGNDLSSRAIQFLGHGQVNCMEYWTAAKSFEGFMPVGELLWVPPAPVDEVPDVRLRTWVNGDAKQDAEASQMAAKPSQILTAAATFLGRDLQPGDYIMCGTPPGLANKVPAWKKRLASISSDRFAKLDAAIKMYVEGADFLKPGDIVEIDAGFVGNRKTRIDLPIADSLSAK